jgi:hypothetical protein
MPDREAFAGAVAVGAALLFVSTSVVFAGGEVPCAGAVTSEAQITGVTASGSLITDRGEEVVLAGLAFGRAALGTDGQSVPSPAMTKLASGRVGLAPVGELDRYGRIHANVVLDDGRWLQAALVAAGLAIVRPSGGDTGCDRELMALEAAARDAEAGLWADSRIPVKASDESSLLAESGLYAVVQGRVVSVGYGSRMVFVDFGHDFRTDFTVMVARTLVPRLLEAGIALESLKGRAVRVRGVLEESGGPAIRLADPLELELLDLDG